MILICFGTRPEWIKIKPLLDEIGNSIPYRLVCTGQHIDLLDNSIKDYSVEYMSIIPGWNRLDDIIRSIMINADWIFNKITHVIVQGDTTSSFGIALCAFNRNIKIIHLEAGLRSWNNKNPFPEEFNRISISNMASFHLCPTKDNAINIQAHHNNGKIFVVGNTVLDNLKHIQPTLTNDILITLHRRENLNIIDKWFTEIEMLAQKYTRLNFIFPMHPNPLIQKYKHILKSVKVIEPLSYEQCVKLVASCGLLITDSGGLQEESAFLKKRCIVCRENTERTEGEYFFSELCPYPEMLGMIFDKTKIELVDHTCPYGDGNSSKKIVEILRKIL